MNSKINANCSILKYLAQVLSQFNENRMKCEKEFQQWRETMDSICLALVVVERWKIAATLLPWHTMGPKTFRPKLDFGGQVLSLYELNPEII